MLNKVIVAAYGIIVSSVVGGVFVVGIPNDAIADYTKAENHSFCQAERICR